MDSFKLFFEKRKHNFGREFPLEIIKKYWDDPNMFATFTEYVSPVSARESTVPKEGMKIGINPNSTYNTPIGIYAYPLYVMKPEFERFDIPFGSERPAVWIFQAKRPQNIIKIGNYTMEDARNDWTKIVDEYGENSEWNITLLPPDLNDVDIDPGYDKTPAQILFSAARKVAQNMSWDNYGHSQYFPIYWNKVLRTVCDGMVDEFGHGYIHTAEPKQSVFWNMKFIKVVELIDRGKRKNMNRSSSRDWSGPTSWKDELDIILERIFSYILKGKFKKGSYPSWIKKQIERLRKKSNVPNGIGKLVERILNGDDQAADKLNDLTNRTGLSHIIAELANNEQPMLGPYHMHPNLLDRMYYSLEEYSYMIPKKIRLKIYKNFLLKDDILKYRNLYETILRYKLNEFAVLFNEEGEKMGQMFSAILQKLYKTPSTTDGIFEDFINSSNHMNYDDHMEFFKDKENYARLVFLADKLDYKLPKRLENFICRGLGTNIQDPKVQDILRRFAVVPKQKVLKTIEDFYSLRDANNAARTLFCISTKYSEALAKILDLEKVNSNRQP